jgi:hypothetical protein
MITCLGAQADLFDLNFGLGLSGFAFLLLFFIKELAVVDNLANRGIGIRGDLYQVKTCVICPA